LARFFATATLGICRLQQAVSCSYWRAALASLSAPDNMSSCSSSDDGPRSYSVPGFRDDELLFSEECSHTNSNSDEEGEEDDEENDNLPRRPEPRFDGAPLRPEPRVGRIDAHFFYRSADEVKEEVRLREERRRRGTVYAGSISLSLSSLLYRLC
jgi:hypothetical protein